MSSSPYLTRFEVDADEEKDDGFLYGSGRGRAGHAPRNILQPQQFGLASRPPPGSVGMQLAMGGDHSTSLLLGAEHPNHRPKMQPGETILYNQHGQAISIIQNSIRIVAGATFHISAGTIILEGVVHLGGEGGELVHRKGDTDSDGDVAVGSASKVYAL